LGGKADHRSGDEQDSQYKSLHDRSPLTSVSHGCPRDDPAVDLFRDALASLADIPHVKRILLELGRLYNPVTNGPILDLASRRRVVELLEAGAPEDAQELLEQCVKDYTRPADRRQR